MPPEDLTAHVAFRSIKASEISRDAYRPYGDLIGADSRLPYRPANNGTARRFNHLCDLQNLRTGKAKLNVCAFQCQPLNGFPLEIKLLEKHPYSTQIFMPLSTTGRYLTIVALGENEPDLSTLSVFYTDGATGVSYRPGVWHYPMTVVGEPLDFACFVHEDESDDDCTIVELKEPFFVTI